MISVIAPVFNEERHLPQMLQSLIDQTYPDWELLILDDGSQDATPEIIEEWASTDKRIKPISLRTKFGKVAAFNATFKSSSGRYICHVGGDDVLPDNSLEVRVRALNEAPLMSVLLGKLRIVNDSGQTISHLVPRGRNGSQSSPGATYSRELADIIFPVPYQLPSEDIWLGNAAVGCAESILHTPHAVVNYRFHSGNSNPRYQKFDAVTESIHDRSLAIHLLAISTLPLRPEYRDSLRRRYEVENLRYSGDLRKIAIHPQTPLVEKLATASMAHPMLWKARQSLGTVATGWRGR